MPNQGKIIIGSADQEFAFGAKSQIEEGGIYDPVIVTGGREIIEIGRAGSAALILLDALVDDLPGFEVCRRIRESGSKVPIVIFSRITGDECGKIAGSWLADRCVVKILPLQGLEEMINELAQKVREEPAEALPEGGPSPEAASKQKQKADFYEIDEIVSKDEILDGMEMELEEKQEDLGTRPDLDTLDGPVSVSEGIFEKTQTEEIRSRGEEAESDEVKEVVEMGEAEEAEPVGPVELRTSPAGNDDYFFSRPDEEEGVEEEIDDKIGGIEEKQEEGGEIGGVDVRETPREFSSSGIKDGPFALPEEADEVPSEERTTPGAEETPGDSEFSVDLEPVFSRRSEAIIDDRAFTIPTGAAVVSVKVAVWVLLLLTGLGFIFGYILARF